MSRTALVITLGTAVVALSACGADAAPEVQAACDSLAEHGPAIAEELTSSSPDARRLDDAVGALSAALPDDQGDLDAGTYQTFLLMNSDLLLISSELTSQGYTLNTGLMPRMFEARDVCKDAGVDVDL